MLTAWYVGFALRIGLLARLAPWATRLPFFTTLIAVYVIQSVGTRYFLHNNEAANSWANLTGPIYCGVRILAFCEAVNWVCHQLPRFCKVGYYWMAIVGIGGLIPQLLLHHETRENVWMILGAVERITGIGVASALVMTWLCSSILIVPASREAQFATAKWHAAVLALWSVADAAGWILIQRASEIPKHLVELRRSQFNWAGYVIIGASIICPILWGYYVRMAPEWTSPAPTKSDNDVARSISAMGQIFDK